MSRGTTFSVMGLYHYDNHLFDNMNFPTGFTSENKQTVIANILANCAELECLYPNYDIMKFMIGAWSAIELPTWQRIYDASKLEYNPIENYNRTEIETIDNDQTDTHSGKDTTQHTGQDSSTGILSGSETHSGTDTDINSITAYDSNALYTHDKQEFTHGAGISSSGSNSNTVTYGRKEELTHGETVTRSGDITRENHTTGNIGVTTSQQMLEQEFNIASLLNVSKIIVESFRERFCLLVY